MINRLILFLIKKKLGVKSYEKFRFVNQKKPGVYWFNSTALLKQTGKHNPTEYSNVSINWLLDEQCKIIKLRNKKARNHT